LSKLNGIPPIHCLLAFEAASRHGSFEKAAEELSVSQSAVSHRVRSLEQRIDRKLFTRTDRGVRLTASGREYLDAIRGALHALGQHPAHQRRRDGRRPLRVAVPPFFAREILVPALGDFSARHPRIDIELLLAIPLLDLNPEGTDLSVRFGSRDHVDGGVSLLLAETMFPVCAPDYAKRLALHRSPKQLSRAVLLRCPFEPWKPWFNAAGLDWPEPDNGPCFHDAGMLIEAAVTGQGVALGTARSAARWLNSGALHRLYDVEAEHPYAYYVVRTTGSPRAEVRLFEQWLYELVAGERHGTARQP
jgi:LysR family glycine cleavage system transcriptional activator